MKILSLILFCLLLNSFQLKAQTAEILDNIWYLEKVVIDQVDYLTPDNEEINHITLEFEVDFIYSVPIPSGCFGYAGEILFENNSNSFSTDDASSTFPECSLQENAEFYIKYIEEFYWFESGNATQIFFYEITEESSNLKKLIITNTNDDQAVYYSETLSTNDVNGFGSVQLYPNPAASHFSVESQLVLQQIRVYNELGQVVLEFFPKASKTSYDISILAKGIYFVELSSSEGKKTLKKLIKN
ncbi:T9SS type A sorting domain-containing protein [Psychroflexus sp. MES1-P1E]|uniref:T9SS type A sorting domain-containing protein n=1 Tax=Psychroflexus sp. MES1-P1E TaxID=2058320 RepID=UPI0011AE9C14|nr:T9SS type A sorting domain-containing protein [Psychroflexus sp. MES1-P1E]